MTVSYKKSGPAGGAYYINCMTVDAGTAVDDYYTGAGKGGEGAAKEPPGTWYCGPSNGSRSSNLGVVDGMVFGSVKDHHDSERFANLIQGWHPENGQKLVQNAGDKDRVALHDFTFSAPKSISVIWSQAGSELKERIEGAQLASTRTALDFLSSKSYSRQGKGGVEKTSAPLIAGIFGHGSSRENDPQLHSHAVVLNVCERADGTTGALETMEMMRWQGAAASLYHADLAWKMREIEFGITRIDNLFEVDGVPKEVTEAFSQRRAQIVDAVQAQLKKMGLDPDAAKLSRGLLQKACIETRTAKNQLTREQLQKLWHERGAALGFTELEVNALMNEGPAPEFTKDELLDEARMAVREITEMNAVFKEPALITKIAVRLVGRASPDQILEVADRVKAELLSTTLKNKVFRIIDEAEKSEDKGKYKADQDELIFTTREMLVLEQQMLQYADRRDGHHILSNVELPDSLLPEQRAAAVAATGDINAVTIIEGTAGAGKTFTMESIARSYEANGYKVTGLSASWKQALNLKEAAKLDDGRAIAGWVIGVRNGSIKLDSKSLIVVDEAGMVGAREMHHVLEIADKAGAKVILLGDTQQQKSVSAGDALRCIAEQTGSTRLSVIFRQHLDSDRQAVHDFFAGRAEAGLKSYIDRGDVHITQGEEETHKQLIADWQSSRFKSEGDQITFIQKNVEMTGVIEKVEGDKLHVRVGNELVETGNSHLILALDKVSAADLNRRAHEARKENGELGQSRNFKNVDYKETEKEVEFSVGDAVCFRKSDRKQDVFNRTDATITAIVGQYITLQTDDGRTINMDTMDEKWAQEETGHLGLQHSYSTTIFTSQGLSPDKTFVKDSLGFSRAVAGVALSRHKQTCQTYVDKAVRYEAKMREVPADKWKHISGFSDQECLERVTHAWSKQREKNSTLDFTDWKERGAKVDTKAEVLIANITAARELASSELNRIRDDSKRPELKQIDPVKELPFQKQKTYELEDPVTPRPVLERSIDRLMQQHIEVDVLMDAHERGFLRFTKDGQPIFCGRRPEDKALVLIQKDDAKLNSESLRNRYPPILQGDSKRVDVVKTGEEALALWSIQDRAEMARSTVIVTSGNEEALGLQHTRDLIERASECKFHDGSLSQKQTEVAQETKVEKQVAAQPGHSKEVAKSEAGERKEKPSAILETNRASAEAAAAEARAAAAEAAARENTRTL